MDTDELAEESIQDTYNRMSRVKKLALLMTLFYLMQEVIRILQ